MPAPQRFRRNEAILWRRTGDGAILAAPGEDGFERLSPTGAAVWELLETPAAVPTIASQLGEVFVAPGGRIEIDVAEIIERLVQRGLAEADADG
jgi:hypothetical protein